MHRNVIGEDYGSKFNGYDRLSLSGLSEAFCRKLQQELNFAFDNTNKLLFLNNTYVVPSLYSGYHQYCKALRLKSLKYHSLFNSYESMRKCAFGWNKFLKVSTEKFNIFLVRINHVEWIMGFEAF